MRIVYLSEFLLPNLVIQLCFTRHDIVPTLYLAHAFVMNTRTLYLSSPRLSVLLQCAMRAPDESSVLYVMLGLDRVV